jgi:diguanylate cyclase (GGDEF)-like protein
MPLIFLAGFALCSALGGLVAASLTQLRFDVWELARSEGRNLTATLAREIARTVETFDLSIQAAAENLALPGFADASPEMRRAAIFDGAANARGIRTLLVLDANGDVVMSSREGDWRRLNYADRAYFGLHRDDPGLGLYIAEPTPGVSTGRWVITFSRRIPTPDGRFAGVVVGAFEVAVWREMFEALEIGSRSAISLVRRDGTLLLRTPFNAADLGRNLGRSRVQQRMLESEHGQFIEVAGIDGAERLYTFQHIEGTPLIVSTAFATADIAMRWQRQAHVIIVAGLSCAGLVVGIGIVLFGELRRRRAAEAALTLANAELERIAGTDAMTGLPNRRAFDERLSQEWRRALRDGRSLSLLVIDVDHFKAFNDAFGHPAGDACLRQVAEALRCVARRPGDLAARIGGEEFALLMPDTAAQGARHMAERVADAIREAAVPHPANLPLGVVTASIGGATASPAWDRRGGAEDLVSAADRALYSAKDTGRNRIAWAAYPSAADQGATGV